MADETKSRPLYTAALNHVLTLLAEENTASRAKDFAEAYAFLAANPVRYDD